MNSRMISSSVLFILLLFGIIVPSHARTSSTTTEVSALVDQCAKLETEKAALIEEKKALSAEEKSLQQEASDLKAAVKKLKDMKLEFKMDADALQQSISQYNIECGGSHPRSVYESLRSKCEPWSAKIDEKNTDLATRAPQLTTGQENIDSRQAKLSKDTLGLTAKSKDIDAKISDLSPKLEELQSKAVATALKDLRMREKAGKACKTIANEEELHCCNSVVWDGSDPRLCGLSNIYQTFKTGGVFGTSVVVPTK